MSALSRDDSCTQTNKIRKVIIITKGTKIWGMIISIYLALTMIISAFFAFVVYLYFAKDPYGIYVASMVFSAAELW